MNFRFVGGHGVVHALGERFIDTTWCGQMLNGVVKTEDRVSCRKCLAACRAAGRGSASPRPGARHATLPASVAVLIRESDSGTRSLALADLALEELERANLAAFRHLSHDSFSKADMDAIRLESPSQWVKHLIIELQDRFDPGPANRRIKMLPLRDTVTAHDELLRLQHYLLPNSQPERLHPMRGWSARGQCMIDGCDRRVVGRGLCGLHWQRARRAGQVPSRDTAAIA